MELRKKRNRELLGPTPHAVAIRQRRPLVRPMEHLILERRKQEAMREEAKAFFDNNQKADFRDIWEKNSSKKLQRNIVNRKVQSLLQQREYSLEERKDKLRELLKSEEEQYMTEIAANQETVLERQARMREKAKVLREKREAERLALVEKKLDQRWRDQCEELRAVLSKCHQDEVCKDRAYQLKLKADKLERQKEEEKMYAALWAQDYEAKCQREETEALLQMEKNRDMLEMLTLQSAAIKKQKEELMELKEKEAQLMCEQAALRTYEEQREQEDKRRKQAETRADFDYSLKLKMKRKTKEIQEELAMDMKMLEQMLQETTDEAMLSQQKKNKLREEIHLYRAHLAETAEEEKRQEKELDILLKAELEQQWAKRLSQWRTEREARRKLMDDVIKTRKQQIKDKLTAIEKSKQAAKDERKKLIANYEQHLQLEKEQKESKRKSNLSYQDDLRQQIYYQRQQAQQEMIQTQQERDLAAKEEVLYQERLKATVAQPLLDKTHPKRLLATRK